MRCLITLILLTTAGLSSGMCGETLPEWFIPLREAVYEQRLRADEVVPIFRESEKAARSNLSGQALYVMLSRCEYMMGRVYQYEERNEEAAARYAEGMSCAEKALEEGESSEAWLLLAENISQSCVVRSTAYAMANGLKVEQYAQKALALNSRCAAARYLIAARWIFAPAPFHNVKKGIGMMEAILTESDMEMEKDDLFNVYSALGYAHIRQKKNGDARPWLLKSLEVYPTNKYAKSLLEKA
jgi:tetratricopeptide (TPR) repeat protein